MAFSLGDGAEESSPALREWGGEMNDPDPLKSGLGTKSQPGMIPDKVSASIWVRSGFIASDQAHRSGGNVALLQVTCAYLSFVHSRQDTRNIHPEALG
jgi:hypothetical protein